MFETNMPPMKHFIVLVLLLAISYATGDYFRWQPTKKGTDIESNEAKDVPPVCHSVPPALWCSCKKLAQTCGYASVCQKYARYAYNERLHLTIFYESLCPDCQRFIADELYAALYLSPLRQLVKIELVPYGNAHQLSNGTIKCQHGTRECAINLYESCALHYMEEPMPFIACLEKLLAEGEELEDASRDCYERQHTVPHVYDQISHCVNGDLGNRLQEADAKRTIAAWPDEHTHVPWVLFNNISLANQQFLINDLPLAVCQLYVGDVHREHCAGIGKSTNNVAQHRVTGCSRDFS